MPRHDQRLRIVVTDEPAHPPAQFRERDALNVNVRRRGEPPLVAAHIRKQRRRFRPEDSSTVLGGGFPIRVMPLKGAHR
jgi:hypothetical protein